MNTKKFITGLGFSTELTNFLLTGNKSDFSIFDIEKKKRGIVAFKTVTDFWKVESHEMTRIEQGIWELFMQFDTPKNATACLLKALEEKSPISDETFKMQKTITPKQWTAKEKAIKTYTEFIALFTKEQITDLAIIASDYAKFAGFETSNFEFQFVNGENGLTLEEGQIITIYDALYGERVWSQVYQASPNGQVSLLEQDGIFTLSAECAKTLRIETENIAEDTKAFFAELAQDLDEAGAERKTMKLERAEKIADAKAIADKLAEEKAEKLALKATAEKAAEAKSILAMKPLKKMKLDTAENIEKVVVKTNASIDLTPAHKKEMSDAIKAAKLALRNANRKPEMPTAETPAETPEASAPTAPEEQKPIIAGSRRANRRQTAEIAPATPAEATAPAQGEEIKA